MMRRPFVLQAAFFIALFHQEHSFQCHAFSPSSKIRRASALSRTFEHYANGQPSPDENDFDGPRGGFSRLYALRGGEATTTNHRQFTNYLSALSPKDALQSIREGYRQRIVADPEFLSKSIFEVVIAASTQYIAEVGRRGRDRILPEIDFVFAGVLTAVFGKYYSMWKVARTQESLADKANEDRTVGGDAHGRKNWRDSVPTNAFQPTLLDGHTTPTLSSRFLAFLLPMPQLFRAGVIASTIGYGFTSLLIQLRTMLMPQYAVATEPISVPLAAIYTGVFMAFVSNIRYQILQGIVEPYMIDGAFLKVEERIPRSIKYLRHLKRLVIVVVRWGNGLLGSWIAIGGMKACGLQKLKD